jgi:hypothetical protein
MPYIAFFRPQKSLIDSFSLPTKNMAVKVVIDTNIWVSAILNPHGFPAKLRESFNK